MPRHFARLLTALAALCLGPPIVNAQEPVPLPVGDAAPDFEIPGATRDGVLEAPIRLSDYRGETVVLAFFYRVRTPG